MKIIHLSYAKVRERYADPLAWLDHISFFTCILEALGKYATVRAIYQIDFTGSIHQHGVFYDFPNFNRWQLLFPFKFNRFVKTLMPDAVIVHGLISPWQVLMLRWEIGDRVKIIVQHHSERPLGDFRKYIQRRADRHIYAYWFASMELGKLWVESGQIASMKKVREILGASSRFFPIEKTKAKTRPEVTGDKIFLWIGRLDANKDPLTAARAFVKFAQDQPAAKLFFIYQSSDLLGDLKSIMATSPRGAECIQLVGKVKHGDLQYWFNAADFIISSSHYEGVGIAVCEAMSCGCIPVVTKLPSFRTMTDNGRIGILYEAGSEEELVNALYRSIKLDRDNERKKVLERYAREFSPEANARKMFDVIKENG
jgi:glycosyltransferase involved in cell wall biosynthesis